MFKKTTTLMVIAFIAAACSKASDRTDPAVETASVSNKKQHGTAAAGATNAAAPVKPGSHEDWCTEHGVPESQCTKCNPDLIAAFKATGDWCVEHALPESQCTLCNPDLKIVRPPKGDVQ